jgi:hypothetical protein
MVKQIKQTYQNMTLYWYCRKPRIIRRYLQYFFTSFGVISFASLLFMLFWVFQATVRFDKQFPHILTQFVQTSLVDDVPNALILKRPLAKGINLEQAEKALKAAAEQYQLKLTHSESLSKTLSTEQVKWILKTFSLLPVENSQKLLLQHPHFAAHLPFRITLYQDLHGQAWVAMPDLTLLIHGLKHDSTSELLAALATYEAVFKTLMASVYGIEKN